MVEFSSGKYHDQDPPTSEQPTEQSLIEIAKHTLDYFEETAAKARARLSDGRAPSASSFAAVNTLTAARALENLATISEARRRDLMQLCVEPAIARVVALDDNQEERTIFIARASTELTAGGGALVASYRSPMGRLAAIPVGLDLEVKAPGGLRTFEVLERASLEPVRKLSCW